MISKKIIITLSILFIGSLGEVFLFSSLLDRVVFPVFLFLTLLTYLEVRLYKLFFVLSGITIFASTFLFLIDKELLFFANYFNRFSFWTFYFLLAGVTWLTIYIRRGNG